MRNVFILIIFLCFSCKTESNKTSQVINKQPVKKNIQTTSEEFINYTNYKEKLKPIDFNSENLPLNFKEYICNSDKTPSSYLLSKERKTLIICDEVCGDFNTISLKVIDGDRVIDNIVIGSEWYEPDNEDEYLKKETFSIDKNYAIKVSEEIIELGKITSSKISNYSITIDGKIEKN